MAIPKNTKKAFIVKAQQRWGNKYDYSKVDYVNSRTSVVIHCKKHNVDFEQTPKAHFAAKHHCCPECYKAEAGIFQNKWREYSAFNLLPLLTLYRSYKPSVCKTEIVRTSRMAL